MRITDFVELYPRLFHMTSADAWPTIERHGLRSGTAILDLLYLDPDARRAIERERRPDTVVLSDRHYGRFEIRDQKPLSIAKLAGCPTDTSASEWLTLLQSEGVLLAD